MSPLRRRLEQSAFLAWLLSGIIAAYLMVCQRTIRWTVKGRDGLDADLADGPVLLVMWHERSAMGPVHWPSDVGPLSSLHDASPIGRVSGRLQKWCGLRPMQMADGASNRAASRMVLRRVREGVSIGMTGDGPLGPAGVVKDAPLDWARVMGRPVWGYAFATTRHSRLQTWDTMMLPKPFGRGAVVFARLDVPVPKDMDSQTRESARAAVDALLCDVVEQADRLSGNSDS